MAVRMSVACAGGRGARKAGFDRMVDSSDGNVMAVVKTL